jgi:hypothetical protein
MARPPAKKMGLSVIAFAVLSGVLLLVAWIATTGRVGYTLITLLVGGALVFALLDGMGFEIVRQERRDRTARGRESS